MRNWSRIAPNIFDSCHKQDLPCVWLVQQRMIRWRRERSRISICPRIYRLHFGPLEACMSMATSPTPHTYNRQTTCVHIVSKHAVQVCSPIPVSTERNWRVLSLLEKSVQAFITVICLHRWDRVGKLRLGEKLSPPNPTLCSVTVLATRGT